MKPLAEPLEAVILSGPRRGEIVTFSADTPQAPGAQDVETLDAALDDLNSGLARVYAEVRAALQSLKSRSVNF